MKNREQILNVINEVKKRSFWINLIEKVSLQNFLSDCYKKDYNVESNYYEIRFYIDEDKLLSKFGFDTNIDEIVEAIDEIVEAVDYFLLPKLREKFIADIKEVSYLNSNIEIVIICESVE